MSNSLPQLIFLPAERWERIASAYSADKAVAHRVSDRPLPVRTAEHSGFLYTAFGVLHGPYGESRKPFIDAYRLLPESMYTNETTLVYHDKAAILAGTRNRGDHTGLIVSAKGRRLVCAERIKFLQDLPGTRPLALSKACVFDARQRRWGWRALWFAGVSPIWRSLSGHPVALYQNQSEADKCNAVLFWTFDEAIQEMPLADDLALSPCGEATGGTEGQLTLF